MNVNINNSEFPKIDERGFDDFFDRFKSLVPFYTPEWRICCEESGDGAGLALVKIFIYLLGIVTRQINRLPEKHIMAFLDRLGVKQIPALPASVPLTLATADGAAKHVVVPGKTRVAAGDVMFETEKTILAAPARLLAVHAADPSVDALYEYYASLQAGNSVQLFAGDNLQRHYLYVGDPEVFNIPGQAVITLEGIPYSPILYSPPIDPQWCYWGDDDAGNTDWHPLEIDTAASIASKPCLRNISAAR